MRKLTTHAFDTRQQVALAGFVDQGNQAVAQLQPELVYGLQVVPRRFDITTHWSRRYGRFHDLGFVGQRPGTVAQGCGNGQKYEMRHIGDDPKDEHDGGGNTQNTGGHKHLSCDLPADVVLFAHA